jgi:hypothetical protein
MTTTEPAQYAAPVEYMYNTYMEPVQYAAPPAMGPPLVTTAAPVVAGYLAAPMPPTPVTVMSAPPVEPVGAMDTRAVPTYTGERVPVQTNTGKPVPAPMLTQMMGETRQMRMEVPQTKDIARATERTLVPETMATREVGQAQYVQGQTTEETRPRELVQVRQ